MYNSLVNKLIGVQLETYESWPFGLVDPSQRRLFCEVMRLLVPELLKC